MTMADISRISIIGRLSSYYDGDFRSTAIDIKELLSGKTSYREEAFCEDLYLKSIEFEIFVHDENNEVHEKAGLLIGRLFDIECCEEDEFDPLEVFDNVDQYTYEIYDMGRKYHEGFLSQNIFAIESLMIYPEFRDKNVGTAAIHILADAIEAQFNLNAGCFIVIPEPAYDSEREAKPDEAQYEHHKARCKEFWKRLGFESLKDSPYWYFNLDMGMLVNGQDPSRKETGESRSKLETESATIYEFPSRTDNKEY